MVKIYSLRVLYFIVKHNMIFFLKPEYIKVEFLTHSNEYVSHSLTDSSALDLAPKNLKQKFP